MNKKIDIKTTDYRFGKVIRINFHKIKHIFMYVRNITYIIECRHTYQYVEEVYLQCHQILKWCENYSNLNTNFIN